MTTVESAQVVVIGSYVQDHIWTVDRFPVLGETRRSRGFSTGPGGKGFNQAIACLRQGVPTAFIGAIGGDPLGEIAQAFAAREGLDCRWLIRHDRPTAASSIVVNAAGENQIAVALGANEYLDPAFVIDASPIFAKARVALMQLENNLDAVEVALKLAHRHRLVRVLNPAPVHPRLDRGLVSQCDVLTPNETEFALLLERCSDVRVDPMNVATQSDDYLHALCRSLAAPTVVVTLGSQGCFVSHGADLRGDTHAFYRIKAERVTVVDTTGAGDAFSGGLAAGLVLFHQHPFRVAATHANRVAALSTEKPGTAPAMPSRGELTARFAH